MHVCLVRPNAQANPSFSCMHALSYSMLRNTLSSFMFVLSYPMLRQTFFMHVCLVRLSAQTNPFHTCLHYYTQCLGKPLSLACLPCHTHCLGKPSLTCLPCQTHLLSKHPFLVGFDPWIQAKPYSFALANHHLMVKHHTPGSNTPLHGFKQHTLVPNNTIIILHTTSLFSFHKLFFQFKSIIKLFSK